MRLHEWMTLLVAHHYPEDYERCTFIMGVPVCRRCFFLYLPTLAIIGLQATLWKIDPTWDPLLTGLAVPATAEFVLERLGRLHYHPGRVVVTSLLLSIPLGRAFVHQFEDPWDPKFWGFILVFGIPAGSAALWRAWKDLHAGTPAGHSAPPPESRQENDSDIGLADIDRDDVGPKTDGSDPGQNRSVS